MVAGGSRAQKTVNSGCDAKRGKMNEGNGNYGDRKKRTSGEKNRERRGEMTLRGSQHRGRTITSK